jgi:parvulin-like peptidyl-prolyl isomerase
MNRNLRIVVFVLLAFVLLIPHSYSQVFNNRVVATINGTPITLLELKQAWIVALIDRNIPIGAVTPDTKQMEALLNTLIENRLLLNYGENKEIEVDDNEVKEAVSESMNIIAKYMETHVDAKSHTESLGLTEERFREMLTEKEKSDIFLGYALQPELNVSQTELDEFIAKLKEKNIPLVSYRLSQIFLSLNPENREEVIKKAYDIMNELRAGADFGETAKKYSEDAAASRGGELGFVDTGQFDPAIENAIRDQKSGDFYGPIVCENSVHIILLQDKVTPRAVLFRNKYIKLKLAFINKLKKESVVRIML